MNYKIISNKVKCKNCGDTIELKSVHDYATCSCGYCFVDGRHYYTKRVFVYSYDNFEELSIVEDK